MYKKGVLSQYEPSRSPATTPYRTYRTLLPPPFYLLQENFPQIYQHSKEQHPHGFCGVRWRYVSSFSRRQRHFHGEVNRAHPHGKSVVNFVGNIASNFATGWLLCPILIFNSGQTEMRNGEWLSPLSLFLITSSR